MTLRTWLKSEVGYGEELVRSAVAGGRSARDKALASEPASLVLARLARTSLPWALMGASIGVLASYSQNEHRATRNAALFGLLGGIIGFGANMALSTRQITEETVRGVIRNVSAARDTHWLSKNPIDYA